MEWVRFRLRGFHSLWPSFPACSTIITFCSHNISPTTLKSKLFSLGYSRFARRYSGNRISFSSCNYLDVSVHCVFLLIAMYSQTSKYPLRYLGSPIRKSPDQSLLTAPRGVSSLVTSFIGS